MQNKYFGDEGDFVKFRLLRTICGIEPSGDRLSLGVVWYLQESKRTGYLHDPERCESEDPELFRKLRCWNENEPKHGVSLIEKSDLFPKDTSWFSRPVPKSKVDRKSWLQEASCAVQGKRVVFLDPDTGFLPPKGKRRGEYVLQEELKAFCEATRKHTVIVYQHRWRSKTQVVRQLPTIKEHSGRACIHPIWHPQLKGRLFYVIPFEDDSEVVRRRIAKMRWDSQ